VAGKKTTRSIRNGIAWLRYAANQARLDGDDETADRLMELLRIVSETMPVDARSAAATPYVGFSNETLAKQPLLKAGDTVTCPQCGEEHELFDSNPPMLLSYRCGDRSYLAGIKGQSIMGVLADTSGSHK
jgi:hypothetical protein